MIIKEANVLRLQKLIKCRAFTIIYYTFIICEVMKATEDWLITQVDKKVKGSCPKKLTQIIDSLQKSVDY